MTSLKLYLSRAKRKEKIKVNSSQKQDHATAVWP
jgi:hypothetical protein